MLKFQTDGNTLEENVLAHHENNASWQFLFQYPSQLTLSGGGDWQRPPNVSVSMGEKYLTVRIIRIVCKARGDKYHYTQRCTHDILLRAERISLHNFCFCIVGNLSDGHGWGWLE